VTKTLSAAIAAVVIAGGTSAVHAGGKGYAHGYAYGAPTSYTLQGTCAFLPADRATEFHGNPDRSTLNLGMAGNQWVVFDKAMQQFNVYVGKGVGDEPAHRPNDDKGFTLADLNDDANRYFIELIPPGQIRKQIKSGCMTLGNDEERNFLPGNYQVDFDVFASTNYDLMQDLANAGFIDEAVPYISNRLDLMVVEGNPKGIGSDYYDDGDSNTTNDAEFSKQFDIIMDLLSGDVVASSLDHINEGIHNAANGYMKKAHSYVIDNDRLVDMAYTFADGKTANKKQLASAWIQEALNKVATPMEGSPSAERLVSRDAGEKHDEDDGHDMATFTDDDDVLQCVFPNGDLRFCEIAVLNKANTHESRVHHVETPGGLVREDNPDTINVVEVPAPENGFAYVDVGFVWITELAYQINNGNTAVTGMSGRTIGGLGIPNTENVNGDKTYSLALLATSKNKWLGRQFIDFLRSPAGQAVYTAGGFTGLKDAQLDGGRCYAPPELVETPEEDPKWVSDDSPRNGDGSCADWLRNN